MEFEQEHNTNNKTKDDVSPKFVDFLRDIMEKQNRELRMIEELKLRASA